MWDTYLIDLLYIVIAIPGRTSAMLWQQGNKKVVVLLQDMAPRHCSCDWSSTRLRVLVAVAG
jgi:hypothetical protein